jgi:hypothetical protein
MVASRSRRSRLTTGALGLCLVVLAGLPAAGARHAGRDAGEVAVAAVADVAVAARAASDRLSPAHRSAQHRQLPATGSLPAAVLVALLLVHRVRRNAGVGSAVRPALLRAAGRGPPVLS